MVDTIGLVIDQSAVNYAMDFMAEVSAKSTLISNVVTSFESWARVRI